MTLISAFAELLARTVQSNLEIPITRKLKKASKFCVSMPNVSILRFFSTEFSKNRIDKSHKSVKSGDSQ